MQLNQLLGKQPAPEASPAWLCCAVCALLVASHTRSCQTCWVQVYSLLQRDVTCATGRLIEREQGKQKAEGALITAKFSDGLGRCRDLLLLQQYLQVATDIGEVLVHNHCCFGRATSCGCTPVAWKASVTWPARAPHSIALKGYCYVPNECYRCDSQMPRNI